MNTFLLAEPGVLGSPELWVAVVSGSFGAMVALLGAWFTRSKTTAEARKTGSESDSVVVGAATDVVSLLRDQMIEMRTLLDERNGRIVSLEREVASLREQIEQTEPLRRQIAELTAKCAALEERNHDLTRTLQYERERRP